MLGTLDAIMMYMSVISTRFKDAELRDVLIQSGATEEDRQIVHLRERCKTVYGEVNSKIEEAFPEL